MFNEINECGIDYGLTLSAFVKRGNRLCFQEWLLPAFEDYVDDTDIEEEEDMSNHRYLSIPIIDDPITPFISFFHANIWYPELERESVITQTDFTPKSKLYLLNTTEVGNIINNKKLSTKLTKKINKENLGKHFYRLNSLSSKYKKHLNLEEAIKHIANSDRTTDTLKKSFPHYLFVREWIDLSDYVEYRCFIHDRQLRGVSHYSVKDKIINVNKSSIKSFINKIIMCLDFYNDFTVDLAINIRTCETFVIEINTPVYAYAGSAKFSINEVTNILMKKCEGVDYPVFR